MSSATRRSLVAAPWAEALPTDEEMLLARLEKLGVAQVRLLHQTGGWATSAHQTVITWLAEKDQEERRRNEASQSEQSQTARSAKNAAWIAAIAAIVAAVVAIIAAVISYLAWVRPAP